MRQQELHPRTAILNKKQKFQAKQARNDALAWLILTFPCAFDTREIIRPLKLGIMQDILAHADEAVAAGISKSKLREAVVMFTRRVDYLACLKAREMRVDLNGNPIAHVTEEEAERASMKIKKRVEKNAKNARKALSNKTSTPQPHSKPAFHKSPQAEQAPPPYYPERPPAYSAQLNTMQPARAPAVVVKHKTSRAYDPDAVARLKEKLGLSRKNDTNKEWVE